MNIKLPTLGQVSAVGRHVVSYAICRAAPAVRCSPAACRRSRRQLEALGDVAAVGCNFNDALAHARSGDVLIGHSYGALHAADAARALKARGIRVKVIAIDPLWTPTVGASCAGVADCVCFWGHGSALPHARNVHIAPARAGLIGHIEYPAEPDVQARVLAAVRR